MKGIEQIQFFADAECLGVAGNRLIEIDLFYGHGGRIDKKGIGANATR